MTAMVTPQPRSGWSLPNTLTLLRLGTIPVFVWLVLSHHRHAYALAVLVIAGLRRADLAPLLDELSPSRLSRQLHRLREIGVIKKVAGTYRYYLTKIGRAATAALCRVTQSLIVPALA